MKITIDSNICFECGAPKEEMHHIVPKSKGGKKTIPLCIDCHGIVHDVSYRRLMLDAAKVGRDKYVANGGKLGRKTGSIKSDDKVLLQYQDVVKAILDGTSIRKIMVLTNTSNGTIQKVKKIMVNREKIAKKNKKENIILTLLKNINLKYRNLKYRNN